MERNGEKSHKFSCLGVLKGEKRRERERKEREERSQLSPQIVLSKSERIGEKRKLRLMNLCEMIVLPI